MTNMKTTEIRNRIAELVKETKIMEESLQKTMTDIINEIGRENHYGIKKVSPHISVIRSSHLSNKNWSIDFFDWEKSAKAVLKYLANTPVLDWKKKLESLLETKGDVVELKKRGTIWPGITGIVQRTPIDRVFIEKIIERI